MDKDRLKVIGIAGTNGSGKDTLGHILADDYGYLFVSVTELLRDECKRRGIKADRHNLRMVSAEWRRQSGLGVLVDKAVNEFNKSPGKYKGVTMASLRNPGEVDRVHQLKGIVIWLDADPKLRYKRIKNSTDFRSHRADEDSKSFEDFMAEEQAEMHRSGDEATLDMTAVKEKADLKLDNSQQNSEAFKEQIAKALGL